MGCGLATAEGLIKACRKPSRLASLPQNQSHRDLRRFYNTAASGGRSIAVVADPDAAVT
jgi:hypothetical protein